MTSATICGLLGVAAASTSLGACSGGSFAGGGDGGTEGGTSGTSGGTSGGSGMSSEGGTMTACAPASVPTAAIASVSIEFGTIDAGGAANGWRSIGFDRDDLCTTQSSTDVCVRAAGAGAASQQDGNNGIDNAWGHTITPLLGTIDPSQSTGYLTTDATGAGTLRLSFGGTPMNVPVTATKVVRQGTTATVSAIVPTEAFVAEVARVAGHVSTSLCSGSTLESIKQSIRQASDLPVSGSQSPAITCGAISLGATLTGVVDGMAPVVAPGPDPCAP